MSDQQIDREQGHDDVVSLLRAAARHPHKGPSDTDSSMLDAASRRIAAGYGPGGQHTTNAVAKVLSVVASLIDDSDAQR